jgi:hypothetical protein
MPGHGGKLAQQTIREPPGDRQLVFALEFLNRGTGRLVQSPGRAELTVAVFRQGALHGRDARRGGDGRSNEIADRIIAARGRTLRRTTGAGRAGTASAGLSGGLASKDLGAGRTDAVGRLSTICGNAVGLAKNGAGC